LSDLPLRRGLLYPAELLGRVSKKMLLI